MSVSYSEQAEVLCPHCSRSFEVAVWRIVDADERPDLRALILRERINCFRCPFCGADGAVDAALLYHDAVHQAVLLALPEGVMDELEIRALVGPLVEALHRAIAQSNPSAYLANVQVAGSLSGMAAEIRSWQKNRETTILNPLQKG